MPRRHRSTFRTLLAQRSPYQPQNLTATDTVGAGHASERGRGNVGRDFTQSRDPTTPWRTRPNSADWYSFAAASDVSFRSGVGVDEHPLVEGKIPAFRPGHLRLTCGRAHGDVAACVATELCRCRSLIGDSMAPGRSVPYPYPYPLSPIPCRLI